jgi:hypothetical protein
MANAERHPIRNFVIDLALPTFAQASEVDNIQNPQTRRRMGTIQRAASAGEVGGAAAAIADYHPTIGIFVAAGSRVTSFVTERIARRINR